MTLEELVGKHPKLLLSLLKDAEKVHKLALGKRINWELRHAIMDMRTTLEFVNKELNSATQDKKC